MTGAGSAVGDEFRGQWTESPALSGGRRVALSLLLGLMALLLLLTATSYAAPADLPLTVIHNPVIARIISQVSTQTLLHELNGLTGERPVTVAGSLYTITTRNSYQTQAISMATRYVYEQFAGYGLTVTYHNYDYDGHSWRNVVAEKPGQIDPGEIYLITAHLDDMPQEPPAPGADDNGSGSVVVLMAARLLAPCDFAYTLRFVLFTGEEQGLRGSAAYAADCASRGEDIGGVVNLDMVAHNSDEPVIDLYGRTGMSDSLELTRLFSDVIRVYGLDLVPNRFASSGGFPLRYSDQWSFLINGYPAILAIEDTDDLTPYYHSANDRVSTLDLDFYADFARAAIATIAHLGRLGEGVVSGTVRALRTGSGVPATLAALTGLPTRVFTFSTDEGGAYTALLPADRYTLNVWADAPGYFPATVTDVVVVTNTITVRDVGLRAWPSLYLPWVCREQ